MNPAQRQQQLSSLPDHRLTPSELETRYQMHSEHPHHTHKEWRDHVQDGLTTEGYWPWVAEQLQHENPPEGWLWQTPDHDLTLEEFQEKYRGWSEYRYHTLDTWQENVKNGETRGYWEVAHLSICQAHLDGADLSWFMPEMLEEGTEDPAS